MASGACAPEKVHEGIAGFLGEHLALLQQGRSFSGYERDTLSLNLGGKGFLDISGLSGLDCPSDGRAAVYLDYDNDGDLDCFLRSMHGNAFRLFRNELEAGTHSLSIDLRGSGGAFGAVVTVKTSAGLVTRMKSAGSGFLSQNDPRLHFGLGGDKACEWIEVRWPDGSTKRLPGVKAGTRLRIER